MITADAGATFEARVESFPASLVGQVGVRLLDNAGGVFRARTTLGVIEDPAGSGSYAIQMTAPGQPGQYSIFWDWDGGGPLVPSHTASEDLLVSGVQATGSLQGALALAPAPALAPSIPHLSLPFRFSGGRAATTEQDTVEEIVDCCQVILRCPQGHRLELPEFGRPDQAFAQGGADPQLVRAALGRWEPRARATAEVDDLALADGLSRVLVQTNPGGAEQ